MTDVERIAELTAALVEARSIIALCDTPRHISDPYLYQITNDLGARHGYGAVMQAAQHAWHDAAGPLMVPGSEQTCGPGQITVTNALSAIDACLQKARADQ